MWLRKTYISDGEKNNLFVVVNFKLLQDYLKKDAAAISVEKAWSLKKISCEIRYFVFYDLVSTTRAYDLDFVKNVFGK